MMDKPVKLYQKGNFTAWRGKLARGDSRNAYVTQDNVIVTGNEKNAWGGDPNPGVRNNVPICSFWFEQEAIDYVKKHG